MECAHDRAGDHDHLRPERPDRPEQRAVRVRIRAGRDLPVPAHWPRARSRLRELQLTCDVRLAGRRRIHVLGTRDGTLRGRSTRRRRRDPSASIRRPLRRRSTPSRRARRSDLIVGFGFSSSEAELDVQVQHGQPRTPPTSPHVPPPRATTCPTEPNTFSVFRQSIRWTTSTARPHPPGRDRQDPTGHDDHVTAAQPPADNTPTFAFTGPAAPSVSSAASTHHQFRSPCTSPHTTAPVTNGTHTFYVRAMDACGQPRSLSGQGDVPGRNGTAGYVDRLLDRPAAADFLRSTPPDLRFPCRQADSSFECELTGPRPERWLYDLHVDPRSYGSLGDGTYTFSVRAIGVGWDRPNAGYQTFTLDRAAPQTTITAGPAQQFDAQHERRNL